MTTKAFIPFNRPCLGEEEIQEVVATLRSGWLTTGPRTAQLEREVLDYTGATHALAVNSCTSGLHLALAGLGIGPGDEVITTPLTFCATVNTILHVGATPVLADVGADGNIDPKSIEARITEKTKAIMPVHLAGLPCDMDAIWSIARRHRLFVIEDAAHAFGSMWAGKPIGAGQSDAVVFSFYATKNLTTAEGGMVVTPSEDLWKKMKILCLHGISADAWNRYSEKGSWYYEVTEIGYKYNLSDLQSALGIHQLRKQEEFIQTRQEQARFYNEAFGGVEELELPADAPTSRHCWHLYMLKLNLDLLEIDRKGFIERLKEAGVGSSVHFIPIPLHPAYARWKTLSAEQCPRAMSLFPRYVSLPLYPGLSEPELRRVSEAVLEIVGDARRKPSVRVQSTTV